jgi:glycine/D-amino acid oxidase-like deaminating enzyme
MEVLVIGGGVIGVCSAYYLAGSGCGVTLIEKGRVGGRLLLRKCRSYRTQPQHPTTRSMHSPQGSIVDAEFRKPFLH